MQRFWMIASAALLAGCLQQASPAPVVDAGAHKLASARSMSLSTQGQASVAAIIKASPGIVCSFTAIDQNAADRYFQLFDQTAALAGGEIPILQWKIPGGGGEIIVGTDFFTDDCIGFDHGIVLGISTTRVSYTAATAGDHDFAVVYR